ncbi:hypothetical protein NQ317_005983 [Molorchus minor]|uniref:Uncharacterized protein n=1 Tax=Molorchus minor TaxID=1323400 RepID=A0ABQ9IRF0_9CUCU|nr:hypothetical protein NQ317_005983 [Molorchus minor]
MGTNNVRNINIWRKITSRKNIEYKYFKIGQALRHSIIVHYTVRKRNAVVLAEVQFEARGLQCAEDKNSISPANGWINSGIAGACRTELVNLTVDDIEDVGSSLIVKIPNIKTKIPRIFVVTDVGNMLELFRTYLSLRPSPRQA